MPATILELAERICAGPADIAALIEMYPDDVDDVWSEAGVLSEVALADLEDIRNPDDARIELGQPFYAHGCYACPECGDRMRRVWVHPPTAGFHRCGRDGTEWRLDDRCRLRPASEAPVPVILRIPGHMRNI